jgi:hypothetical protein
MSLPNHYPARIRVCPVCQKPFNQRWLLSRHLRTVHRLRKTKADEISENSEYLLAPKYLKKNPDLYIKPDDYYFDEEM